MSKIRGDIVLIEMDSKYLMSQDQVLMRDYLQVDNRIYAELEAIIDSFWWDCSVEGRLAVKWIKVVKSIIVESGL